jgi:hypothetical protein
MVATTTIVGSSIDDLARLARAALIVAAQRRTTLSARELGAAIGLNGIELAEVLRLVLARLAEQCADEQMPALPALVTGHVEASCDAAWFSEAKQVFRRWGRPDRPVARAS